MNIALIITDSDNMCVNECILVYITWNIEKRSFFNHSAIVQVITSVFFSKSYLEDKLLWDLNPDDRHLFNEVQV